MLLGRGITKLKEGRGIDLSWNCGKSITVISMGKKVRQLKGSGMLMVAALIWGTAFVAQTTGMDYLGPCTFNGVRSFIGSLVLLPVIAFAASREKKDPAFKAHKESKNI